MGPAVAEMEFDERPNEPVLFFAADKTDPGAFNLPLYLAFADPMTTPGLILAPKMAKGFRFVIMDVNHTEGDRIIELEAPEELYLIAALLRDPERYVVESVWSRATGDQACAVATSRLHNIAGKYTGKDDPVMLVRTQMNFPATGEVLAPYRDPFCARQPLPHPLRLCGASGRVTLRALMPQCRPAAPAGCASFPTCRWRSVPALFAAMKTRRFGIL